MDRQVETPIVAERAAWEILVASLQSFNAGDLQAAIAYYDEGVEVKLNGVPPGERDTYQGKEEVRAWFQSLSDNHFTIQEELTKTEGDTLYVKALSWSDSTRQLGVAPLEATEVYVVREGRIASLTWTISAESAAKLEAALSRT